MKTRIYEYALENPEMELVEVDFKKRTILYKLKVRYNIRDVYLRFYDEDGDIWGRHETFYDDMMENYHIIENDDSYIICQE